MSTASVERQILDVPADDGSPIYEFKISSGDLKIQLICLSYGATITKLMAPDRKGASENIALCYESVQDIKLKLGPYYGSVPGRYANRIARGKFRLDGEDHQLATNNGLNSLHGGTSGFDKKNWTAAEFAGSDGVGVQFSYISPDKEEGYPGELHVDVTYMLNNSNELVMDYSAIVVGKATVLNLTNHTYCKHWNIF
jgi:aldose 1-epimerase